MIENTFRKIRILIYKFYIKKKWNVCAVSIGFILSVIISHILEKIFCVPMGAFSLVENIRDFVYRGSPNELLINIEKNSPEIFYEFLVIWIMFMVMLHAKYIFNKVEGGSFGRKKYREEVDGWFFLNKIQKNIIKNMMNFLLLFIFELGYTKFSI